MVAVGFLKETISRVSRWKKHRRGRAGEVHFQVVNESLSLSLYHPRTIASNHPLRVNVSLSFSLSLSLPRVSAYSLTLSFFELVR